MPARGMRHHRHSPMVHRNNRYNTPLEEVIHARPPSTTPATTASKEGLHGGRVVERLPGQSPSARSTTQPRSTPRGPLRRIILIESSSSDDDNGKKRGDDYDIDNDTDDEYTKRVKVEHDDNTGANTGEDDDRGPARGRDDYEPPARLATQRLYNTGRPRATTVSDSTTVQRRRALARDRVRAHRARKKTEAQMAQVHHILQFDRCQASAPAPTEPDLGLRVSPEALATMAGRSTPGETALADEDAVLDAGPGTEPVEGEQFVEDNPVDDHGYGYDVFHTNRLRELASQEEAAAIRQSSMPTPNPPSTTPRSSRAATSPSRLQAASKRIFRMATVGEGEDGDGDDDDDDDDAYVARTARANHNDGDYADDDGDSMDVFRRDEREGVESTAMQKVALSLLRMLSFNDESSIGCSEEEHRAAIDERPIDYITLEDLNDRIATDRLPIADDCLMKESAKGSQMAPRAWQRVLSGTSASRHTPEYLSLEASHMPSEVSVCFDIDSVIGFASSLGFAKQGIDWTPHPNQLQNIRTDVHLQTRHDDGLMALKDCPHFPLGRLRGDSGFSVYVLFPHVTITKGKNGFTFIDTPQVARWHDEVFAQALRDINVPSHVLQHLPSSYSHAALAARAPNTEKRSVFSASHNTTRNTAYTITHEYLEPLWERMQEIVESSPGLKQFREAQLCFNCKNIKLQTKQSTPVDTRAGHLERALCDTVERWKTTFRRVVDVEYVYDNLLFVDVAREDCPSFEPEHGSEHPARVLGHRRCCLKSIAKELGGVDVLQTRGARMRFYDQHMLWDIASMTMLPPKRGDNYAGGLVYSQFYSSAKEVLDAQNQYPFHSDAMEELSLDPSTHKSLRATIGGKRSNLETLEKAYLSSKKRAYEGLSASIGKNYGIRQEHRVSFPLLEELTRRAGDVALASDDNGGDDDSMYDDEFGPRETLAQPPRHALSLSSTSYMSFLVYNINKFCLGFESVRVRSDSDRSAWEDTKMMAMFLRCLRYAVCNVQMSRETALWHDVKVARANTQHGLGFGTTLPKYGYCWILADKIDWDAMVFNAHLTRCVLFGTGVLQGKFYSNRTEARKLLDDNRRFDFLLQLWSSYADTHQWGKFILRAIAHDIMKQMRKDVLHACRSDYARSGRPRADRGCSDDLPDEPFTAEYLSRAVPHSLQHYPDLRHNRITNIHRSFEAYFAHLFGLQGNTPPRWAPSKPFLHLYQKAQRFISLRQRAQPPFYSLDAVLEEVIVDYHPCMPYANKERLVPTRKEDGARQWVRITNKSGKPGQPRRAEFNHDDEDNPPLTSAFPDVIYWDEATWEDHLQWALASGPATREAATTTTTRQR